MTPFEDDVVSGFAVNFDDKGEKNKGKVRRKKKKNDESSDRKILAKVLLVQIVDIC